MNKLRAATFCLLAALLPFAAMAADQPKENKKTTTKKAAGNSKKPAEAKDNAEADKVKTDERMSTRSLKPPQKTTGSDQTAKPDNPPKP